MADAVIEIGGNASGAVSALNEAKGATENLGGSIEKAALVAAGAFAAITGVIGLAVNEFKGAELAQNKLAATLQSTGFAAGLTSSDINALATEIQSTTIYSDEAALASSSLLLTFDKLGKDIFPRAQKSIVDVAAGLGIDLQTATLQVGKALNDPIEGLAGLSRVGIRFSDVQKKLIQGFVESGEVGKAQALILTELETRFGGQAAAATKGLGAIDQLKNSISDLGEVIGAQFAPFISQAAVFLRDLITTISNNAELIKFSAAVLGISAAFAGLLFGASSLPIIITTLGSLNVALIGTTTVVRGLVGATGLGLLVLALGYIVTHMAEVENATRQFAFAIFGAFDQLVIESARIFGNLKTILSGLFTFDVDQIAEGLAGVATASVEGARNIAQRTAQEYRAGKEITKQIIITKNAEVAAEELKHGAQVDAIHVAANAKIIADAEAKAAAELAASQGRSSDLIGIESDYANNILAIDASLGDSQVSEYDSTTGELVSSAQRRAADIAAAESRSSGGGSSGSGGGKSGGLSPLISKGAVSSNGNVLFDDSAAGRAARAKIGPTDYNPFTGQKDLRNFLIEAFSKAGVQFKSGFSGVGSENLIARFSGKEIVIPETFAEGIRAGRFSLGGPGAGGGKTGVEISFQTREASKVLTARETASRKLGTFRGNF